MIKLEKIPALFNDTLLWKRYIDDTICFIKIISINKEFKTLENYHRNINFTIEIETKGQISSLDFLQIRIVI